MKIKYTISALIQRYPSNPHDAETLMVHELKKHSPSAPKDVTLDFFSLPGGKYFPTEDPSAEELFEIEKTALCEEVKQETGSDVSCVGPLLCTITKHVPSEDMVIHTKIYQCEIEENPVFKSEDPDKTAIWAGFMSNPDALQVIARHPDYSRAKPITDILTDRLIPGGHYHFLKEKNGKVTDITSNYVFSDLLIPA